jgi:hypothetical protein
MHKTKRFPILIGCIPLIIAFLVVSPALAQGDNTLVMRLSRDFGYSGSGQIQGTFTIHVTGPANLSRVDFLIDGKQIGEATTAPFNLQFTTSSYSLGMHTISAAGTTTDGQVLHTPDITAEFVSAETGLKAGGKIAIPILIIAGLAVLISALLPALTGRGKRSQLPLGQPRTYGFKGGGICPKCGRPFSFSLLAPNLPFYRFDRCPNCGRLGLVRMASLSDLRKAEAAELETAQASQSIPEESEEEKLRKELDDSRYQGS